MGAPKDAPSAEHARKLRLGLIAHPNHQNLGRVVVYSDARRDNVVTSTAPYGFKGSVLPPRPEGSIDTRRAARDAELAHEKRTLLLSHFFEKQDKERVEAVRKTQEVLARRATRREQHFQGMLSYIADGSRIGDIENYLETREIAEAQRREQLCKVWNQAVHVPIQEQVEAGLTEERMREVRQRRFELHADYLRASKQPGGIFRDIIHEDEYDAMSWTAYQLRYSTRGIDDPLKRDLKKFADEAKLTGLKEGAPGPTQRLRPCRRLDVCQWGKGKIEATPHGYFANFFAKQGSSGSSMPSKSKINSSHIVFDHYTPCHDHSDSHDFPSGGKKIAVGRSAATFEGFA